MCCWIWYRALNDAVTCHRVEGVNLLHYDYETHYSFQGSHAKPDITYLQAFVIVAQHRVIVGYEFLLEIHSGHAPMHTKMDGHQQYIICKDVNLKKKKNKKRC